MARIRTIKPEFWSDENVSNASPYARLLFIASWNFSDDHGGLDRSAKQLKAQGLPHDNVDAESLIQELLNLHLLIEYEVDGKFYLHIKGFNKHQRVERIAGPRVPLYEESMRTHRAVTDSSLTANGKSPTSYGLLGIKEGNGREGKGYCTAGARQNTRDPPLWFQEFKSVYPRRAGDQNWRGALRAANARMAEGHTANEFIDGAGRYAAFIQVTGKLKTEFVKQAASFLGPGKPFLEPWDPPATKAESRLEANLSAVDEFMQRTEDLV